MSGRSGTPNIVVVLDGIDIDRLASFWEGAIGYSRTSADDTYIVLVPTHDVRPELVLQRVSEPKQGKNRMHLDLRVDDLDAEVERLESLGAVRLGPAIEEGGVRWIVMGDPEGNEFCVGVERFERRSPNEEPG
jgi:predicted enzyme related to lactoylglutathione lyase